MKTLISMDITVQQHLSLKDPIYYWIPSCCKFKPIYKLKSSICCNHLAAFTSIAIPTKVANLCKEHPLTSYLAVYASGVNMASMGLHQRLVGLVMHDCVQILTSDVTLIGVS